eukprot:GHVU01085488.1.p1 GENE.GHVU01085488.1~~GHVU01085488.1.p1  ORF type:complete len:445 (-),score=70.36 GHVU01085488.1:2087-3421(-)
MRIPYSAEWRSMQRRINLQHAHGPGTTKYMYLSKAMLEEQLRSTNEERDELRLKLHTANKQLGRVKVGLDMNVRVLRYLAANDIPRVSALLAVQMQGGASPTRIMAQLEKAVSGLYKVKSFTDKEQALCILIARLGGRRLAAALQEAGGLAAFPTVKKWMRKAVVFKFCHAGIDDSTVAANITQAFQGLQRRPRILMCDEMAVPRQLDVDLASNTITGCCYEHLENTSLEFTSAAAFDGVLNCVQEGRVCVASEALLFTVAGLGDAETAAIPIVGLASCKTGGKEKAKDSIQKVLSAWSAEGAEKYGPLWAFGTDGDGPRRSADDEIFRVRDVDERHARVLRPLLGLDIKCSAGGIVVTPDWKHIVKRLRNLLINDRRGVQIGDFHLTPTFLQQWLSANKVQVKELMRSQDKQNVPAATRLLRAIADADASVALAPGRANTVGP